MDDKRVGIYFDIILNFYRAMAVYASRSGANIWVKLIWINARCPRQPGGTECSCYVMRFMKEIAYEELKYLTMIMFGKE
ncbi:hypothetical protein HanIR_Chr17g0874461 [Helianthus annuus]|nr:hypothetical protein HanIR_Chr17g0874461 [Helianthus annuus]